MDAPDAAAEESALKAESQKVSKHDAVTVLSAKLLDGGKSVALEIKDMKPAMQLKIGYDLETSDGAVMIGETFSTVKSLE